MRPKLIRIAVVFLASLALLASVPAAAAPAAQSAGSCTLAPTGGTITRTVGGRPYHVNVPAGLTRPAPLIVALHGAGFGAWSMEAFTGLDGAAAQHGFIVAYPEAQPSWFPYWNPSPNSPDVAYLRQVVSDISSTWCVDARRIHSTGWSRGGAMSLRFACDASDIVASASSYAGSDPTLIDNGGPCNPSRPISIGIFQGVLDPVALVSAYARDQWVARDGCPATPSTEPGVLVLAQDYGPCKDGTSVLYRLYLQSHNWPVGADQTDINNRIYNIAENNPLP